MTEKDSQPQVEAEPVSETTQTNKQDAEREADVAVSPPVVKPLDAEDGEPQPAESYDGTDRKQDETLSAIAEQTEWEAKQTELMDKQTVWIRRQAIWTIALTAATLGVLIYHGLIMGRQTQAMMDQTKIMQGQLDSMKEDSAQTQQMIDATKKSADASQSIAEQNRELTTHAGEQAKASLAQAEAAKQSVGAAQASAKAAERGAQIAQQSFYIGDRPYVFAGNITIEKFAAGVKPKLIVVFSNTGKTPALNFTFAGKVSVGREPSPAKDSPGGMIFEPTMPNFPGSRGDLPAGERMGAVIEWGERSTSLPSRRLRARRNSFLSTASPSIRMGWVNLTN